MQIKMKKRPWHKMSCKFTSLWHRLLPYLNKRANGGYLMVMKREKLFFQVQSNRIVEKTWIQSQLDFNEVF
jgi:hypothetical protein